MSWEVPLPSGRLLTHLAPGSRVAGYRLEEQVGAGGMAVVFAAWDERLRRRVALKVLAPALAADQEFRLRFIRESRAAAAVDDPHIIPVYEAGESGGVLFIAMRFVSGGDLRSVLRREGPLAPGRALALISPIASALDAAHAAGLAHRDVKPGNILVDARAGRPGHVYLSDFGLSKAVLSSAGLTGTGNFLGTPNYAAPEQVNGQPVDGRVDQYALGCVAFELLAGTAPFARAEPMAVLWAHLSEPPPSLAERRPDLPGSVDWVLARALAKAPPDRFGSCQEFTDALREALGLPSYDMVATGPDRPPAVPVPPRRNGPPPSTVAPSPAGDDKDKTRHRSRSKRARTAQLRDHRRAGLAWVTAIVIVVGAIVIVVGAIAATTLFHPGTPRPPVRTSTPVAVHVTRIATLRDPDSQGVISAAFSADGKVLAAGDINGSAYLWDVATHRRITALPGPKGTLKGKKITYYLESIAFSPDGGLLAVGYGNAITYEWGVATHTRVAGLADPDGQSVYAVAFSPDGALLAAGDHNGSTYLWNVASATRVATLPDPKSQNVYSVAFSPDGKVLATGDFNGSTYLWDVASGARMAILPDPGSKGVPSVAFSPAGKVLAAGDHNGSTYLWDVASGARMATLPGPKGKGADSVAFSPDGRLLAVGYNNGSTYLWDVASGARVATLRGPKSTRVYSVAFSPDGRLLATGDYNGSTYLWQVTER